MTLTSAYQDFVCYDYLAKKPSTVTPASTCLVIRLRLDFFLDTTLNVYLGLTPAFRKAIVCLFLVAEEQT